MILGVACPTCAQMLEDGIKAIGGEMKVMDVAEIFEETIDSKRISVIYQLASKLFQRRTSFLYFINQFRHDLIQISDYTIIGYFKYRS